MRQKLYEIIFEADTPAGKLFDIILLVLILASVGVAMLETIPGLTFTSGRIFYLAEWIFTGLFTIEYLLRIYCSPKPKAYIFSFFGVIDLLSILPTFFSVLFPGSQSLLLIRSIRLLRIFRILKLTRYLGEANVLLAALKNSRVKVTVFIGAVMIIVTIVGAMMYLIEGPEHGFTSVPTATYWAIVTLTTVGYGDISPGTPLGKFLACILMVLGYGFIAVPTGIVSVELANAASLNNLRKCSKCNRPDNLADASFCRHCGSSLL
jgi:voltage-gated potassium channel